MLVKLLFFIMALLVPSLLFAQERKVLRGRVTAGNIIIKGREVINLSSQGETKTDSLGNFYIKAAVSDTLQIRSSISYLGRIIVKEGDFITIIAVDLGSFELEEVVIDRYNVNAESLGLVPEDQKQYTPAERRLKTAGDFKPIHLLGILGGSLPVDPIINAINGRTKRLKKEVEIERKEFLMAKINGIYTYDEITKEFNIPEEYVSGFIYYVVEDSEFAKAMKNKNETLAKFLMSGLSVKYIELITEENEEK